MVEPGVKAWFDLKGETEKMAVCLNTMLPTSLPPDQLEAFNQATFLALEHTLKEGAAAGEDRAHLAARVKTIYNQRLHDLRRGFGLRSREFGLRWQIPQAREATPLSGPGRAPESGVALRFSPHSKIS